MELIAIVNWMLYVSGFLRLFMMSFKYGLTLIRYSSTDSLSDYVFRYLMKLLLRTLSTLIGLE